MMQIEDLNEDVLRKIFSYLNIYEQQRMGLVCRKWQNINQMMLRSIRKMTCQLCYTFIGNVIIGVLHDRLIINTDDPSNLEKPLKKFADDLDKIEIIHETWNNIPSYILKLLTRFTTLKCARLESGHPQTIERFLEFLPTDNLEILSIEATEYTELNHAQPGLNNLFSQVLTKMRKLNSLNIYNVPVTELGSIGGISTLNSLYLSTNDPVNLNFDSMKLQNLELISIVCTELDIVGIKKLMEECKKLHSIDIFSDTIFPEDTVNAIITLPNLRRLSLTIENMTDELWNKFSNLEDIKLNSSEPLLLTKAQIISFLQRSKNLKKCSFLDPESEFDDIFRQVASDIGREIGESWDERWVDLPPYKFKI